MKSVEMQQTRQKCVIWNDKDSFKTFESQNKSPLEGVLTHIIFYVREAG